jgi:hypothetical protein
LGFRQQGFGIFYFGCYLYDEPLPALVCGKGKDVLRNTFGEPIVYTQPRIWLLLLVLVVGGLDYKLLPLFAETAFAATRLPPQPPGISILLLFLALAVILLTALLVLLTVFGVMRLISPAVLSISKDGVTFQAGARLRRYDWQSITNLRLESFGRGAQAIYFDYPSDTSAGWLLRLIRREDGPTISLGGNWDADNGDVMDALNAAQGEWFASHPECARA